MRTKLKQRQRRLTRVEGTRTDEQYEQLELEKALLQHRHDPVIANLRSVISCLARFLYVLRSNIAHGHKTPKGPNVEG